MDFIQKTKSSKLALANSLKYLKGIRVPLSPSSNALKGVQALILGLLTSFGRDIKSPIYKLALPALGFLLALIGLSSFSQTAYAASYINVSSGSGGTVSLGSIRPSSSGTSSTGSDTLTIHTDCSTGYSVYASGQKDKDTNLTNSSASSNNTIATSSTAVGSTATALNANTWGLNSENTGTYVGLPTYADATNTALTTKTSVAEESTVPIYYGIKVDTSIVPGTYTGNVLYTVLMDSSCLAYTVSFDANGGTGTMNSQSIMAGTATKLTANSFTRSGYTFLGWSTKATGKTGTANNGIGTEADVDYTNQAEVTDLTSGGSSITLYAIWSIPDDGNLGTMQDFVCNNLTSGHTATLTDSRDGQTYSVYRIPVDQTYAGTSTIANVAGKCLMTKDLNLGAVNSVSGASSSITANGDMTISPDDSGFTKPTGADYEGITIPTTATVEMKWSPTNSYSNKTYHADGTGNYAGRGYYSWGAAMVVCPKGWYLPSSDKYSNSGSWESSTIGISAIVKGANAAETIANITSSPYSFVRGGNYSNSWYGATSYGYYWSSNQSNSSLAYYLSMRSFDGLKQDYSQKNNEYSVRCMADPVTTTMQDFDASAFSTTAGDATRLVDSRDGKVYTVKRLPDGKVWMMQNLTVNGTALTPSDTNIDNGTTYYLPKDGGKGSITDSSTTSSTSGYNFDAANSNQASFKLRTKDSSVTNDSDTGYYNFYTTTLGFSYYNDNKGSGSSTRDICPKSWRLPWTSDSGNIRTTTADFYVLATSYNQDASWSDKPTGSTTTSPYTLDTTIRNGMYLSMAVNNNYAGFSPSGIWNGVNISYFDSNGPYWSSSVYNIGDGYNLDFNSSSVYPQHYNHKYLGFAVRCIAQNKYTINYSNNGATSGSPSKTTEGTVLDGATVTLPTVGSMVKSGYGFKGWALTSSATTATYEAGASVSVLSLLAAASSAGQTTTPGSTLTLYPVWVIPDDGNKGNMQTSNICSSIGLGHTATLTDTRDNQAYSIYRWPNTGTAGTDYPTGMAGYCIMTKDLSLGYVTGGSITKGSDLTLTTATSAASGTITARTGTSDWSKTNDDANLQYINGPQSGKEDYSSHSYYTYGAAKKVCPKTWHLPTKTEYDNITIFMNGNDANGSNKIRSAPYNFVLGGNFHPSYGGWSSVGSIGFYWPSTQYSDEYSYFFTLRLSNNYLPTGMTYTDKNHGMSVRCVAAP